MNNMFVSRKINYQGSMMVNICDQELVGTKVREGKLTVNITKDYFGKHPVSEDEVIDLLSTCSVANLVGKR